jgi:hypothetical protein
MAKRRFFVQRKRIGPRRSRITLGAWPVLFFLVLAGVAGFCAIAVNIDLEDKIIAYYAKLRK